MCGPNLKSVTLMSYGNFFYCQVLKNEDLVGALGKMIKKLFFEFRSCNINDKWHIASISEGNTALGGELKLVICIWL